MNYFTGMGKTEGPEPQVRGRVGDGSQAVLNSVNGLVDKSFPELKLKKNKKSPIISDSRLFPDYKKFFF